MPKQPRATAFAPVRVGLLKLAAFLANPDIGHLLPRSTKYEGLLEAQKTKPACSLETAAS